MIKKTITYEDYDGNTRTQDFWFNLSQREIARMEVSTPGGFEAMVKRIIDAKSQVQLIDLFENLIHMSYGVKSADGVHFIKNEEGWQEFASTNAYNDLYMELITDRPTSTGSASRTTRRRNSSSSSVVGVGRTELKYL